MDKLTTKWINEGKSILDPKHHQYWAQIVPVRLSDIFKGMELEASLNIIEQLNSGCSLEEALNTLEQQEHSGLSLKLVCSMVKEFCDRGDEFVTFVEESLQ